MPLVPVPRNLSSQFPLSKPGIWVAGLVAITVAAVIQVGATMLLNLRK